MINADVIPNLEVRSCPDEEHRTMLVEPDLTGNRRTDTGRVWKAHKTQEGLWFVIHPDGAVAPYWSRELEPAETPKEPHFPIG